MDMAKVLKGMNPNAMLESWACDSAIPSLKVMLLSIAACSLWPVNHQHSPRHNVFNCSLVCLVVLCVIYNQKHGLCVVA